MQAQANKTETTEKAPSTSKASKANKTKGQTDLILEQLEYLNKDVQSLRATNAQLVNTVAFLNRVLEPILQSQFVTEKQKAYNHTPTMNPHPFQHHAQTSMHPGMHMQPGMMYPGMIPPQPVTPPGMTMRPGGGPTSMPMQQFPLMYPNMEQMLTSAQERSGYPIFSGNQPVKYPPNTSTEKSSTLKFMDFFKYFSNHRDTVASFNFEDFDIFIASGSKDVYFMKKQDSKNLLSSDKLIEKVLYWIRTLSDSTVESLKKGCDCFVVYSQHETDGTVVNKKERLSNVFDFIARFAVSEN